MTQILAYDWSILVTWPGYWPLIGGARPGLMRLLLAQAASGWTEARHKIQRQINEDKKQTYACLLYWVVFVEHNCTWKTRFYELEYRFNLYSDYELAETFARDIRRRHNSILHTKWKPMRNPIAPYTFTRLNVHSRHSTDIRQTFK